MLLQQDLLQKFVDKIIGDVGYNINIIDNKGIIVASGSKERIGTFHTIGYEAAQKQIRIDINEKTESKYEGVKAGINQPFYYNGKLAGVIGISGNYEEINEFVKLVKSMIELMVEQELLKEKMYYRQSNKSYFANLLLNIKNEDDKITLLQWSAKLGYDLTTPRTAIVVEFDTHGQDILYSEINQQIKNIGSHSKDDFSSMIGSDKLLILKYAPAEQRENAALVQTTWLTNYCTELMMTFKNIGLGNCFIGISSQHEGLENLSRGYDEAIFCIEEMKKSTSIGGIGSIYDYMFPYIIRQVPPNLIKHFIGEIEKPLKDSKDLLETVQALSKNHMNLVDTAKYLYVHRNTVVFRLNKLKELTGLDPTHVHRDRMMCHLLSVYTDRTDK